MNIGQRIQNRRKELGLTADDVAAFLKKDRSTVYRYESNDIEKLPTSILEPLSKILQTTPAYLMGWKEQKQEYPANVIPIDDMKFAKIPVIGKVAAGTQCFADMDIIDYDYIPADGLSEKDSYVFLNVIGDSMFPDIKEGDRVLVRCQSSIDSGSIAVVNIDDEDGIVKKVIYGTDWIELQSINPMYPPRRFEGADVQRIRVFGLVKKVIRNYN